MPAAAHEVLFVGVPLPSVHLPDKGLCLLHCGVFVLCYLQVPMCPLE